MLAITIIDEADAARLLMLRDRVAGEDEFQRLLKAHPDEPTIYLRRGEAYEALGKGRLAVADYRKAEELLAASKSEGHDREASAGVIDEGPCLGPDRPRRAVGADEPPCPDPAGGDPTEERIAGRALGGGYVLARYI